MAISRSIKRLLDAGRFDELGDEWLAHTAEAPGDLDFSVGVLRALVGVGEEERAQLLFELLDGQLVEAERWEVRLELLRRLGRTVPLDPEWLHAEAITCLEHLYPGTETLEPMIERVGLRRAVDDVAKNWRKIARLRALMQFDRGAIVRMKGKGVGRVVDINMELASFRVDFHRHGEISVGFAAADKMLDPLPPGHLLRRKLEGPEELERLRDEEPGTLLGEVLSSYGRAMTAGEIRRALAGIVDEKAWASWWAGARKHPQVVMESGGRHAYAWADSLADAHDAVWSEFEAAEPAEQLKLLRREAGQNEDLAGRMAEHLAGLADDLRESRPAVAVEILLTLEGVGLAPDDLSWSPADLLAETSDPAAVARSVEDRKLRGEAYELLRRRHEEWPELYGRLLLTEEEPRLLDGIADALEEQGEADRMDRAASEATARPNRHPATFTWLVERAAEDERLRRRRSLTLLQQLLRSRGAEELKPYRKRLQRQCETGGTLPRLLPELDAGEAARAEEAIRRTPHLETYEREPLITALHLRFPELAEEGEQPLYALPASIAAKRRELETLLQEELPANRQAIAEARELGDLRENFEYKSARQRHEYLSSRATNLSRELERSTPLDLDSVDTSQVRIGSRLTLERDGEEREITLLGPWESDPDAGVVSYESELGQRLLGAKPGGEVTVEPGGGSWRVERIERADEGVVAGGRPS